MLLRDPLRVLHSSISGVLGIGRARFGGLPAGQQASKGGTNSAHCPRIYHYDDANQYQGVADSLGNETGDNCAEGHQACYGRRHKEGHKYAYTGGLSERSRRLGPTKEAAHQWSQGAREEVQEWRQQHEQRYAESYECAPKHDAVILHRSTSLRWGFENQL